jgi:hypothetical protein
MMPTVVDSAARPPRIGILSKPLFANVSREVPAEQQENGAHRSSSLKSRHPKAKIGTAELVHIDASLHRDNIAGIIASHLRGAVRDRT